MHLIGYKGYQKGFFGCLETEDCYTCFLFSRRLFRPITTYAKADFECHEHFLATLHKFVPRHFFLRRPVPLASLNTRDVALVGQALARLTQRKPRSRPKPTTLRADKSGWE